MKQNFLKENFALIIGLGLPVILVLSFLFARYLPQQNDEPPNYELVFSTMRYDTHSPFHIDFVVKDQKLYMKLMDKKEHESVNTRELFIYNAQKQSTRKIHYSLPDHFINLQNEILIKEFSPYVIDTNSKSPDGYELEPASYRSRGLLGELFGSNAGKHSHRVKKPGGRGFPISDYGSEFSYSNFSFIGWIIQSDQ